MLLVFMIFICQQLTSSGQYNLIGQFFYEGRGLGAELNHAHRPDNFKSTCYGPDRIIITPEYEGVLTSGASCPDLKEATLLYYIQFI